MIIMIKKFALLLLILAVLASCGRSRENGQEPSPPGYPEEPPPTICTSGENGEGCETEGPSLYIPAYNEYRVILEIDPATRMVDGISSITFTNRTGVELETIVFRVYLNAFQEGFYPQPFFNEFRHRVFRGVQSYGYMNVHYAHLGNEELAFELDGTVLTLVLPEPLLPDVTIELHLQYDAYIPMIAHRIGGNDNALWFGMFLPVLAVHGENGWHTDDFHPAGAPFILEAANYSVEITTPIRYVVVGTGQRSEWTIEDTDTRNTNFEAHTARDFAFVISPYFNHAHAVTESGIDIHLYYYTDGLEIDHILEHARLSMEHFEYHVGRYPYGHITIVEADTMLDGAAFSQIVFVDTRRLLDGDLWALSHGIGVQWFASIVGTNRISEPWLTNGLIHFAQAGIFYPTPEELRTRMEREHGRIASRTDLFLSDSLDAFATHNHYSNTHRRKAKLMFYALYQRMGTEAFWGLLNQYYHLFSFGIATSEDFIRLAEEAYGDCLFLFFDEWIRAGDVPDLP